jgi:hypothetical protein
MEVDRYPSDLDANRYPTRHFEPFDYAQPVNLSAIRN